MKKQLSEIWSNFSSTHHTPQKDSNLHFIVQILSQIKYLDKTFSLTFPDQAQNFLPMPRLSLDFQTFGDFDMIFPDFPACIHPELL